MLWLFFEKILYRETLKTIFDTEFAKCRLFLSGLPIKCKYTDIPVMLVPSQVCFWMSAALWNRFFLNSSYDIIPQKLLPTPLNRPVCVRFTLTGRTCYFSWYISVFPKDLSFFRCFSLWLGGINLFSHVRVSRGSEGTFSPWESVCVCVWQANSSFSLCRWACWVGVRCGIASRSSVQHDCTRSSADFGNYFAFTVFSESFHLFLCCSFLKLINSN